MNMEPKFNIYDSVLIKREGRVSHIIHRASYITEGLEKDKIVRNWSHSYTLDAYPYRSFRENQLELISVKAINNLQFHSFIDDICLKFGQYETMKRLKGSAAYQGEQEQVKVESAESSNDKEGE